jgi:glycosyltransferase involved in cell wall biosynthesis
LRPLRIILLVTQMEGGGAQAAAVRVASGLRGRGHNAETWFLYRKRSIQGAEEWVRVMLDRPPRTPLDYLRVAEQLGRRMRAFRPDAVVSFTHYANVLGQCVARAVGVPGRVASQRNPAWSYPRIARIADRVIGSLGWYSVNVMVSRSVADSFARYPRRYRRRATVVYNGVPFTPSSLSREAARRRFGLPLEPILILNIGRLSRQKNQQALLKALPAVAGAELVLVGDGELSAELRVEAKRYGVEARAHFLGEIGAADVPHVLRAADVFAMPSRYEGMSNALLEALCAGLPIAASNIPPQAEVLRPDGASAAGLLVAPDDVSGWESALNRLTRDAALRHGLGLRALERARDFELERMIDGFERCVEDAVSPAVMQ